VGLAEDILGEVGPQIEAVQGDVADLTGRVEAEAETLQETAAGLVDVLEALESETAAREQVRSVYTSDARLLLFSIHRLHS
jgi:hypothetical protein